MKKPVQLQIKQSGGWRSVLTYDSVAVPPEFQVAADTLVRLSGVSVGMRIVICIPDGSGGTVATHHALKHWTRETGWVNT